MKKILFIFCFFPCILTACKQNKTKAQTTANTVTADGSLNGSLSGNLNELREKIKAYYEQNLTRTGFSGQFLVAKNGEVMYEDYAGYADFRTEAPMKPTTSLHVASTSKTFTGMTLLRLWEQGRVSLDDDLHKFFPRFPYNGITVKLLLSHRSGLPNYLQFMNKGWNKHKIATNEDVLNFMIQNKPPIAAAPDKRFQYCNTNFMLLALIIEKITHQPFPEYMKDSVFTPLGLNDTYIFSIKDTDDYVPTYSVSKPFPMDYLDCTYGDKNVYTTARDLLEWDQILYDGSFVKNSTLEMAYKPRSNERHSIHNYGYAWRMLIQPDQKIIYHNGLWHGTNAVFTRYIQDSVTIIVIGNKTNSNIYHCKNLGALFTDSSKIMENSDTEE
ncbi:MAG: beta-lactamase family protein [Chitinophagaceae bacterium]|nr:beta-lactamase family protein [Chitinophagaceae bacterium]